MEQGEQRSNGFGFVLEMLGRRKWLALLIFAGTFTAAASVLWFLPNVYESTATVLIEHQQIPEAFVKSTVTSGVDIRLQTGSQEILSRSRLENLIQRFNLYAKVRRERTLEDAIEEMRKDIKFELKRVELEKNTSNRATVSFSISFRGGDPRQVASVTNTLASAYIDEDLKVRAQQAVGTAQFLRTQLEGLKTKLDEQERRVSAFKESHIGELPEQLATNLATLESLNTQLRLNSENQIRVSERQAGLARQLAEARAYDRLLTPPPPPSAPKPETNVERLTKQVEDLQKELAELRARFSAKYPDVVQAQARLVALEEELAKAKQQQPTQDDGKAVRTTTASPNSTVLAVQKALSEAEAESKALKVEAEGLRRTIALYQQRVENTPRREQEFQGLSRDYLTTKESYASLMKRQEEAELAESMEQRQKGEQLRILDPAIPATHPAAPKRLKLIPMALALSLGLAAGVVLLIEQLHPAFHTVEELRTFSPVRVLVSIPRIVTAGDRRRECWRFGLTVVPAVLGLMLIVGGSYWMAHGNEQLLRLLLRK